MDEEFNVKEEFDTEEDLDRLVPSIRKNFWSLSDNVRVRCLHCLSIIPKRILLIAAHDHECGGEENARKIKELEEQYKNKQITIEQFNAEAMQVFEIENNGIDLSQPLFTRSMYE